MPTLEERLTDLEQKVAAILKDKQEPQEEPWWRRHFGAFKDDPTFDDAVRQGAEYRKAQPNAADNPEAFGP